jgi:hypothetical protein
VGKGERKRPFRIPGHILEVILKLMLNKWAGSFWTGLIWSLKEKWQALVNPIVSFRVPYSEGIFLIT